MIDMGTVVVISLGAVALAGAVQAVRIQGNGGVSFNVSVSIPTKVTQAVCIGTALVATAAACILM